MAQKTLRMIETFLLFITLSFNLHLIFGQTVAPDIVTVIDTRADLTSNPGWSVTPECDLYYEYLLPQFHCKNPALPIQQPVPNVELGFWANCATNCQITYRRQVNETIQQLELITLSRIINCTPSTGITNLVVGLDRNTGSLTIAMPPNASIINLGAYVATDRIDNLTITPAQWIPCPTSYYLIDKIVLHKRRAVNTGSPPLVLGNRTDLREDLLSTGWRVNDATCLYQLNAQDFICRGAPVPVLDTRYVGRGFWMGCEQICTLTYDALAGEIIQSLEVSAIYNNAFIQVNLCRRFTVGCVELFLTSPGEFVRLIDFQVFIPAGEQVKTIQVLLPSKGATGSNSMLDILLLNRTRLF